MESNIRIPNSRNLLSRECVCIREWGLPLALQGNGRVVECKVIGAWGLLNKHATTVHLFNKESVPAKGALRIRALKSDGCDTHQIKMQWLH